MIEIFGLLSIGQVLSQSTKVSGRWENFVLCIESTNLPRLGVIEIFGLLSIGQVLSQSTKVSGRWENFVLCIESTNLPCLSDGKISACIDQVLESVY